MAMKPQDGRNNQRHKYHVWKVRKMNRSRLVAQMTLEGKTGDEIGAILGIKKAKVSTLLKEALERWDADLKRDVQKIKAESFARYNRIFAEAMRGWRRSQKNKERETTKETKVSVPPVGDAYTLPGTETTKMVEGQAGDSAFLDKALKAQQAIDELMGTKASALPPGTEVLTYTTIVEIRRQLIEDNAQLAKLSLESVAEGNRGLLGNGAACNGESGFVCQGGEQQPVAVGATPGNP
jgi:hypothetical protein